MYINIQIEELKERLVLTSASAGMKGGPVTSTVTTSLGRVSPPLDTQHNKGVNKISRYFSQYSEYYCGPPGDEALQLAGLVEADLPDDEGGLGAEQQRLPRGEAEQPGEGGRRGAGRGHVARQVDGGARAEAQLRHGRHHRGPRAAVRVGEGGGGGRQHQHQGVAEHGQVKTKVVTKEVTKVVTNVLTKVVAKVVAKVLTKEVAKVVTKVLTKVVTKVVTKDVRAGGRSRTAEMR